MKKIVLAGSAAGVVLLMLSLLGLYATIWVLPGVALQYYDPFFTTESSKVVLYYIHPFVISFALSWFWSRVKGILSGSFVTRGVEFGLIYALIAIFPMMLLIYSAMNVSFAMVCTWFVLAVMQGVVAGLVFEKINP